MDLAEKVIKQVTYYFSDSNLLRDKFMKAKVKEDDGWISLDCLLTFNRLKLLCNDKSALLEYLEKEKDSFLEVDREKMAVRRQKNHPLPDMSAKEFYDIVKPRTIIMKGFPQNNSITIDIIENFINECDIKDVVDIRLMRNSSKEFVGKIYVQFKTEESAKKVLETSDEYKFKFEDHDYNISKITVDDHRTNSKKKKEEKARERFYDQIGYEQESHQPAKGGFQPGKLIHFDGATENITRELIKDALKDTLPIKWIHFSKGDVEGVIEMEIGGDAIKLEEKLKNIDTNGEFILQIKIDDNNMTKLNLKVVEGQQEINFWRSKLYSKKKKSSNFVSKKRMRKDPKNVESQGKYTKFSDNESSE